MLDFEIAVDYHTTVSVLMRDQLSFTPRGGKAVDGAGEHYHEAFPTHRPRTIQVLRYELPRDSIIHHPVDWCKLGKLGGNRCRTLVKDTHS